MEKILPTAEPAADAYVNMGMEFAMFQTNEKYYPWLVNNFIQIYALKDMYMVPNRGGTLAFFHGRYADWQMFEFSANPYLDYEKISYDMLDLILKGTSLIELLTNAIDGNRYVFMPIDEYEIPLYSSYRKRHVIHHVFITGYDNDDRTFSVYDNFLTGKYQLQKVSYDNLIESYVALTSDRAVASWSETGGICFFRFYQKPWHEDKDQLYSVNIETIKNEICEYLMLPGYATAYRNITHYVYGVDCYDELIKILDHGISGEERFADHRAFSSMRDHKKVMIFRLEYLQKYLNIDLSEFIDAYAKIKESMDVIVNKIIKGNISKRASVFESCIETLEEIKKVEIATLSKFIENPIQQHGYSRNNQK